MQPATAFKAAFESAVVLISGRIEPACGVVIEAHASAGADQSVIGVIAEGLRPVLTYQRWGPGCPSPR